MHESPHQAERRKHRRYAIRDHLLVTNTSKNGPLVDISLGGVSFYNISSLAARSDETIRFGTIIGSDFCLSRVPLEQVSVSVQGEGNQAALDRFGLKYGLLTDDQKEELTRFLQRLK